MASTSPVHVQLIGPLPPPIGGDTRHFLTLSEDLKDSPRIRALVTDVSRGRNPHNRWVNIQVGLRALGRVLWRIPRTDVVSVHASDRGMNTLGAAVVMLCKVMRRPVVIRLFGGSYGDCYEASPAWKRWWMRRFVLSADVVLLQTRRMIRQLEGVASGRIVWFSTYLPSGSVPVRQGVVHRSCRRFAFLGHLWRSKGVGLILEAAREMPEGISIDLWGPLDEYSVEQVRRMSAGRVTYRGVLKREEVIPALTGYDCLLLPTQHPGEGYPGVIAEAFTAGIPVIATRWLAIPEIVDDSCGLLIDAGSAQGLRAAMDRLRVDDALWRRLCEGAADRAELFSHSRWSAVFTDVVESIARPAPRDSPPLIGNGRRS